MAASGRGKVKKFEKDAWDWTENVDCDAITTEHLHKVYRIDLASCEKQNHKINCKGNPNCLSALGEQYWTKELDDDVWYSCDDPENEKRSDGAFVGLKNLGATCYVNTFLQVWFHNVQFRSVLYSWIPLDEQSMSQAPSTSHMDTNGQAVLQSNDKVDNIDNEMSQASAYNVLKNVGNDLKKTVETSPDIFPPLPECTPWTDTKPRFIDPAPFLDSLGLDKEQQQDAQEFCKLFLSLLEDTLSQQPDITLRNIVQQQFGGTYVYITKCSNCGKQSERNSKFYELDLNIQGHASLSQCIKEFLKTEELIDDNQYYCNYCSSKQDATRLIKLRQLPPVLNLQLLRFVFDRKTGYKKKLNSNIYFPEVLNMGDFVDSNLEGCVYDLTAVLIHRGLSAYSGHYIAHIKDKGSGSWYRFNDESIEKMKGKSLRLDSEEDLLDCDGSNHTNAKKMKLSKGSTSKDAYMLVYTQRGEEKQIIPQEPPLNIQEIVARDNSKIDAWLHQVKTIQETLASKGRRRQDEITRIYNTLPAKVGEDYEWFSTDWIRKWLSFDEDCRTPIDNSTLLCPHGLLNPDKVVSAKRISVKVASFFYRRYGGLPRLKSDSFCLKCVRERCRSLQFSSRLNEDQKYLTKALKMRCERTGYWVSKSCLRRWRNMAINIHDQLNPKSSPMVEEQSPSATDELGAERVVDGTDITMVGDSNALHGAQDSASVKSETQKQIKFNEDLICEHGCLSTQTTLRRLLTPEVWKRLLHYFPDAPAFSWKEDSCSTCLKQDEEVAKRLESSKLLAIEHKTNLSNLYNERERPKFDNQSSLTCYALSRAFYEEWKKFLRAPARCVQPSSISNKTLICPHGGFLYKPECYDNDCASSSLIYVWALEWSTLCQVFDFDLEIEIVKEVDDEKQQYFIKPECCVQCNAALVLEHFSEAENFERANIYVRKITEKDDVQSIYCENPSSPEVCPDDRTEQSATPNQFFVGNTPRSHDDNRRRSSRHRRQRGEVILTVDSFDTIRDIKLQLTKHFSVLPSDQHLSIDGKMLVDDSLTAGFVGIRPGSILLLKMDEVPEDGFLQEDLAKGTMEPEEGFKGHFKMIHNIFS